jgi:hypothetical protein
VRPHEPLELVQVRRERGRFAADDEPAQPFVGAVPGVREDRDVAGVYLRAGGRKQLRRGPFGAEDVGLEARVEMTDQVRGLDGAPPS